VNTVRPSGFADEWALGTHCFAIELSAANLDKNACNNIVICPKTSVNRASTEHQRSNSVASTIFDLSSWIIQGQWDEANPQSTYWHPVCCKNTVYDITSAFHNWAPTEPQIFLWRLGRLHRNEVHCAVPKLSFMRLVLSICPCIQLHKYACNDSQILFFGL